MLKLIESLWAGDEASRLIAQQAEQQMLAAGVEQLRACSGEDDEDPNLLIQRAGNVAVISIRGSLINASLPNWVAELFGVTTYQAIREAAMQAAADPGVAAILLDIASGGGAVSGLVETADLLADVDANSKPIYTYGADLMANAAVWLGVVGRTVAISRSTLAGSIGVIYTHLDYSEQLKQEGVQPRVFRAGKYKALGQPVEKLTEAAEEQIQARLDNTYALFIEHVAARRNKTCAETDQKMAQGREFYGQQAVDVGLVDKVCTFEACLAEVQRLHPITQPVRSISMPQRALLDVALAAAVQGTGEVPAAPAVAPAPAAPAQTLEGTSAQPAEGAVAALSASGAPAPTTPATAPAADPVLAYVQGELREAQTALLKAQGDLAASTQSLQAAQAAQAELQALGDQLSAVVRDSVTRLRVALSLPAIDAAALSGVALLAEQKSLQDQFASKFKSGGIAAVAAAQPEQNKATPNLAAVQATRFHKPAKN